MKTISDSLCYEIFNAGRKGVSEDPCVLTEEEKTLLIESLPSGRLFIYESDHFNSHVVTEDKKWFSKKDKAYQIRILHAFRALCKRGYIQHTNLCLFKLSRHGIESARCIMYESKQELCEANIA